MKNYLFEAALLLVILVAVVVLPVPVGANVDKDAARYTIHWVSAGSSCCALMIQRFNYYRVQPFSKQLKCRL